MKRVGVICGGFSSEYEISVKSATTIVQNIPANYSSYLILLSKKGWKVRTSSGDVELDPVHFTFEENGTEKKFDVVIVYVHGDPGENGKIQAWLEMNDIRYINSSPLGSALSFDKWFCNQFLKGFGISVAKSVYLQNASVEVKPSEIIQQLGLPVFVKPCDSGSSYGITKVSREEELLPAIRGAFDEGNTLVIEGFLDGTEVTCGVYRTTSGVVALPVTEIVSNNDFFDYAAKYSGDAQEITPARIDDELTNKVQSTARKVYEIMQLRSIARIDFIIMDGEPHLIEVNTTPGFSPESIVPKMIKASGKTIREFWTEIFEVELN